MPGIASPDQTIQPINPATLVGRADPDMVSPRNVALLGDAFRQGFVTTDDIIKRVGTLGRSQDKAQIDIAGAQSMAAQEQMSPEAQAARAAGLGANTSQQQLAQAEAERKKVLQQYPAVAYFDKFAPAAGITAPTTSDGLPDYKQMEKIGSEMAVWQSDKTEAQAFLDNVIDHKSFDEQGREITSSQTKQGEFVDQGVLNEKRKIATRPFSRRSSSSAFGAPGTASAAPFGPPAPGTPGNMPVAEVTPRALASLTIGSPAPGGYYSGAAKQTPVKPDDAAAAAMKLTGAQALVPVIAGARAAVARGSGVGPLEGSTPAQWANQLAAALGLGRRQEFSDQRILEQAISAKILEGAQVMKGNLSDKDVRFLQATVPKLSDTEEVWNTYLDRWSAMNNSNIAILSGQTPRDLSVDRFAPADWVDSTTAASAAPATGGMPTVKTVAEVSTLPPTVQFFIGGDGERYKNPNYKP